MITTSTFILGQNAKELLLVLTFAFIIGINLVGKMIVLFAAQTFMLWEIYEM